MAKYEYSDRPCTVHEFLLMMRTGNTRLDMGERVEASAQLCALRTTPQKVPVGVFYDMDLDEFWTEVDACGKALMKSADMVIGLKSLADAVNQLPKPPKGQP
jgi:hypothetical protein